MWITTLAQTVMGIETIVSIFSCFCINKKKIFFFCITNKIFFSCIINKIFFFFCIINKFFSFVPSINPQKKTTKGTRTSRTMAYPLECF